MLGDLHLALGKQHANFVMTENQLYVRRLRYLNIVSLRFHLVQESASKSITLFSQWFLTVPVVSVCMFCDWKDC